MSEGLEGPSFTPQPPDTPGHSNHITPSEHSGDSGGGYHFVVYSKGKKNKKKPPKSPLSSEADEPVHLKLSDQARKALEIKRSKKDK